MFFVFFFLFFSRRQFVHLAPQPSPSCLCLPCAAPTTRRSGTDLKMKEFCRVLFNRGHCSAPFQHLAPHVDFVGQEQVARMDDSKLGDHIFNPNSTKRLLRSLRNESAQQGWVLSPLLPPLQAPTSKLTWRHPEKDTQKPQAAYPVQWAPVRSSSPSPFTQSPSERNSPVSVVSRTWPSALPCCGL